MKCFSLRLAGLTATAVLVAAPFSFAQTPPPVATPKPMMPRAGMPPKAATPAPPAVKLPAGIAARVDGHDISRDEVLAVFDMVGGRPIIGQMVQALALENEAKRVGVTISDTELNQAVQEMKDRFVQTAMQNGNKPMQFKAMAVQFGITEEYVRYSAHLDLLRRKTFIKSLSAQIPPIENQLKLAHILIATVPVGQPEQPSAETDPVKKDAAAKTKIEGIQADIAAKKITFEQAAKTYSDDKSNAAEGGALPWAGKGVFDPAFETAAYTLKAPGDVAGPVKSQFGYHLIKLVAIGKSAPAAEKIAYRKEQLDRITQQSQNPQVVQQWFEAIMQKAKITVNPALRLVPAAKAPSTTLFPTPGKKTVSR